MNFFENVPGKLDFQPFATYHFLAITVLLIAITTIFVFKKQLRQNPKIDLKIRITASIIAFTLEVGFHLSNLLYHTNFVLQLIPLDLCAIALWLSLLLNITKKPFVFTLLYFWGIGAVASFTYPDIMGLGPDKWRYYHFFGVHAYIILTVTYFTVIYGFTIQFKHFLRSTLILAIIAVGVRAIDVAYYATYQTDWMFLVAPPKGVHTILDALPKGGWAYFFSFVGLAISVFFMIYVPWGLVRLYKMYQVRILSKKLE